MKSVEIKTGFLLLRTGIRQSLETACVPGRGTTGKSGIVKTFVEENQMNPSLMGRALQKFEMLLVGSPTFGIVEIKKLRKNTLIPTPIHFSMLRNL